MHTIVVLSLCVAVTTMVVPAGAQGSPPMTNTTKKSASFVHPGLLHTETDFARMEAKVVAQESPWIEGGCEGEGMSYKLTARVAIFSQLQRSL